MLEVNRGHVKEIVEAVVALKSSTWWSILAVFFALEGRAASSALTVAKKKEQPASPE
jgi:hypothetical protein